MQKQKHAELESEAYRQKHFNMHCMSVSEKNPVKASTKDDTPLGYRQWVYKDLWIWHRYSECKGRITLVSVKSNNFHI